MDTPLRRHRLTTNQNSRRVAVALGVDPSYYRRIEIGEAKASPVLAAKLAAHFKGAVSEMEILYPERYAEEPLLEKAS